MFNTLGTIRTNDAARKGRYDTKECCRGAYQLTPLRAYLRAGSKTEERLEGKNARNHRRHKDAQTARRSDETRHLE